MTSGGGGNMSASTSSAQSSACCLLLLFVVFSLFEVICVDGRQYTTSTQSRQLQATLLTSASSLNNSSGGESGVASPLANKTIFGTQLAPGWTVLSLGSGAVRQQQVAGAVSPGSTAFCATLPVKGVSRSSVTYRTYRQCTLSLSQ